MHIILPSWPGLSRPSTPLTALAIKTWMPATSAGMTIQSNVIPHYAGSTTGAGAVLPRIRSEPFSAITMVAE